MSSNFTKILPVGAELFHADGRTGGRAHDKVNIRFLQLTKAHKSHCPCWKSMPICTIIRAVCILLELLLWLIVPGLYVVGSTLLKLSFHTKPT
jgi:hypothetical protein